MSLRVMTRPPENPEFPFSSVRACIAGSKCKLSHRSHHLGPVTLPQQPHPICPLQVDAIEISSRSFLFLFSCNKDFPLEATLNHRTSPPKHDGESQYLKRSPWKGFFALGPCMAFLKPVTALSTLPGGHVWGCQKPQIHYELVAAAQRVGQTSVFITALMAGECVHNCPCLECQDPTQSCIK